MTVLGINAYHGDVAAAILHDGQLLAAVEEERFRRVKHWAGFPAEAISSCLRLAGLEASDIEHFAVSRRPRAHVWRKALFTMRQRPAAGLVKDRVANAGRVHDLPGVIADTFGLDRSRVARRTHWVEHHPAHLASSFFVSPFERATICAIDGFGDFVSTSTGIGADGQIHVLNRVFFPHSLGVMYLAITQYLGFHNYGDEFKVMGLAPYGVPEFTNELRRLVRLQTNGMFELDLSYFKHHTDGVNMSWTEGSPTMGPVFTEKLERLLGPARRPEEPITERHEAIAASLQQVFEEAAFHVLNGAYQRTRIPNLALAGGCAMNSVMNGKIRSHTPFENVYVQPAAGDNGTALGAAYYVWCHKLKQPRTFAMDHAYWGPSFDDAAIEAVLRTNENEIRSAGATWTKIQDQAERCRWTAQHVSNGAVVGWFQNRMEWGARALGNRSIIADPRRANMREIINAKIKFREKFRPFAPSVLEEAVGDYFVGAVPDPFMITVYPVRMDKREEIPAVTHVDGSGRLQSVSRSSNPLYWELIRSFGDLTGVPILLNTSFNENEPIVLQPQEALHCFLRTQMDVLVMGSYAIVKETN